MLATVDILKQAICRYAGDHANPEGVALTPIEGLRMMCVRERSGPMHSIYKPLVCLVLQGAKQMTIGLETHTFRAGQSVVVALDAPVTGLIVEATADEPYTAAAVELDMALVRELATGMDMLKPSDEEPKTTLFVLDTNQAALDCVMRLVRLLDTPEAVGALRPAIMKELHYWLLAGCHGSAIRGVAMPDGQTERIATAARLLREEFFRPIAIERLAAAAGMSVSTFSRRFKALTSLTPLQFQKELRLVEARRLMLAEGRSASQSAFAVGYESVSHFTRDYGRLFGASPRRHVRATAGRQTATSTDQARSATLQRPPTAASAVGDRTRTA